MSDTQTAMMFLGVIFALLGAGLLYSAFAP